MPENKPQVTWAAENVLSWVTHDGRTTQRDLNRYYLLDIYNETRFAGHILNPGWFSAHAHRARPEKAEFILSLKQFLLSYRPAGRITIFRYLNRFFVWQSVNHYDYGTPEGVETWITHLVNDIRRRKLSVMMARHYLSAINCFLIFSGQIKRKYEYEFVAKGTYPAQGQDIYTRQELAEILRQLMSLNEFLAQCIREHIDRSRKGIRHFTISLLAPLYSARFRNITADRPADAEIVIRDVAGDYLITSFFLFCYHTWGNTSQVLGLTRDSIHLDEKGASSDYVYKARASKYIRLTLGRSEYVTKRAGYDWFLSYISLRDELVDYLVADEHFSSTCALFPGGLLSPGRILTAIDPNQLTRFCSREGAWAALRECNPLLPSVRVSRLRKTAEQYTDRVLKNGLITTEKAQHDWKTYRANYAAGNPVVARETLSAALDTLLNKGVAAYPLAERVKIAGELGIDLRGSAEDVNLLLNGLGCRSQEPLSETGKSFIKKQERFGRTPKACADYSNCVECARSCVVETVESVWLLLSFRHAIEYGKPVYIGSATAKERYETLVAKINLRLGLIDKAVLDKARRKMNREGVAAVWQV